MKGLLIKDLLNVKNQAKIYILLLLLYLGFSLLTQNFYFASSMLILLSVILVINTFAYDEKAKWDKYALTMNCQRKHLVLEKYVLSICLMIIGFFLSLSLSFFVNSQDRKEVILVSLLVLAVGIFILSLVLPILFKFGVEKGRLLMMLIILIPSVLVGLLNFENIFFSSTLITYLPILIPIATILILLLSVLVSLSIYSKKEF